MGLLYINFVSFGGGDFERFERLKRDVNAVPETVPHVGKTTVGTADFCRRGKDLSSLRSERARRRCDGREVSAGDVFFGRVSMSRVRGGPFGRYRGEKMCVKRIKCRRKFDDSRKNPIFVNAVGRLLPRRRFST